MPNLFKPSIILEDIGPLLRYLPITLGIALVSIFFALLLGFIVAVIKINRVPVLEKIAAFYVSFMRGTPILVQLYLSYYGIPILLQYINFYFGMNLNINKVPNVVFVLVAFSLNEAAYASENIRAAILSVDKGQREAGLSIGMTTFQTYMEIIIPEALIVAIPSLGNELINMVKSTSLAFVCAVVEMTAQGKLLASRNVRYFEMYIALSLIYWAITFVLAKIFSLIERKLKRSEGRERSRA
ncbi:MAG: amino acid ABC transporter permease [Clostridiales bacterium]|nr:amino acid ABC transporter permease [Clostridiales bacterium]